MAGSEHPATLGDPGAADADDRVLLTRLARRDEAALRLLIARHGARLHRIAWRLTGDPAEAEDIAQESLLRLWDHAQGLAAQAAAPGAWLTRVATNLALDRLRRARRLVDQPVPDRADESADTEAGLEAAERARLARSLIAALPDRQRAAIVLTYFEEMPNAEAARVLEMNIKAFESLLLRARNTLRAAHEGLDGGHRPQPARARAGTGR